MIINTPTTFTEKNKNEWFDIGEHIHESTDKEIIFNITGGGGKLYVLRNFLQYIYQAKLYNCKFIANICGEVVSAHAFLAAYADEIIFTPNSRLIFHSAFATKKFLGISYKSYKLSDDDLLIENNAFKQAVLMDLLTIPDVKFIKTGGELCVDKHNKTYRYNFFNFSAEKAYCNAIK